MDVTDKSDSESEASLPQTQAGDSLASRRPANNDLLNGGQEAGSNGDQPNADRRNEDDRNEKQLSEERANEEQPSEQGNKDESDSEAEQESADDKQSDYERKCGQADNPEDDFGSSDWLDLLDNREIFKRILSSQVTDPQNPTLPRPNRGCKATINLETRLYSSQQPIASECFTNLEVIVGDYDLIHGVDLILPMMHLYERSRVVISPRFGYGSKGRLPDVAPNSRLDCIVELLAIQDDLDELPSDEKVALAEKKKIRGNFWFTREEYQSAISCYSKCIELFETLDLESLDERARRLLIDTQNNLSLTYIRIESFNQALDTVNQVLVHEPANVKALFRKAQVLEKKCDLLEAVELLKTVIELQPENSSAQHLLIKLRKRRLIELENEKRMYQKMINNQRSDSGSDAEQTASGDNQKATGKAADKLSSKTFNYTVFTVSAIVALMLAFLINQYLSNFT